MKIHPLLVPILAIGALLGTVVVAQATGNWSTSGRTAVNLESFAPDEIKGWMTLEQISLGVGIPLDEMCALVDIPADVPPTAAVKELEELVPGFEVTTLREALAAWQRGEPWPPAEEPAEDEAAPEAEPAAPEAMPLPAAEATPAVTEHAGGGQGAGPTPLPPGQVLPAEQVKGRMTLGEVSAQCAVPLEALLAGLGLPAGTAPDAQIKDLVSRGLVDEVTAVQQVVAGLQAAAP